MHTITKTTGLAGFPKRDESIYDAFGAGNSSTSISTGLGMAVARDLLGKKNHVICVIGDGAMTAGQAYEAMNNAGYFDANLVVVLNDNGQVSLPTATLDGPATPVGALSNALSKLQASTGFLKLREAAKNIMKQIGGQAHEVAAEVDEYARGILSASGCTLFEELGLERVIPPAEAAADKMHGIVQFHPKSGKQIKSKSPTLSYTQYFAESLIKEAEVDKQIVAIHAAMGGGTGFNFFQKRFPDCCFDVEIAEQHAITFAAGLATEGGTRRGSSETTFMAPSDEAELMHMFATAVAIDDRPSCFRFPRGNGVGIGNGRILMEGSRVAILGFGSIVQQCIEAANLLNSRNISVTVADARFCKPLDAELIMRLANEHEILITVEEGSIGGFGSHVSHFLSLNGRRTSQGNLPSTQNFQFPFVEDLCFLILILSRVSLQLKAMVLPDRYIDHGAPQDQIEEETGLSSKHISSTVLSLLGSPKGALKFN
ncbi:hypothetical protein HHK36_009618 [Tetracentron sinense]|uniref:1-deoxy-D-xylulose-5-phosphate synthase n=1 Tax=Tetracentron sinense TaxID=13715 RepID=A0A834ZC03_TETSI|nr:hypothetical protein HHK36_009618 [Tetracentron sinense]